MSTTVYKSTLQGPPSGPPISTQSAATWKKLDPSETMVLNQNTLLKINDILQNELVKRE